MRSAVGSFYFALIALHVCRSVGTQPRPNFIVILLDDLDATQDSSGELAMPATKRLLADRGVKFTNHIVTTPICCPSRVNLLRGQLSHNTNFTDVLGPHGGYAKFRALGLDREWLPGWLQRAGYNTLYTGKFIVDYTILNRDPPPSGWTAFDALVHPFTFEYYCPAFSLNGGPPRMYPAQYVTDVVAAKAQALLRSAAADPAGRPFFLQVAPPAPHHSMHYDYAPNGTLRGRHWYPPVPADRHWELFSGAALPRPPSFNEEDLGGKPAWLQQLERLSAGNQTFLEEVFRLRLRSLRAVDELVEGLVALVGSLGLADSTYVLFTSDNGYHEGAHRMGSGKTTAYEEDLRVPLLVAGPGLQPGSRLDAATAHIDLAPTLLALAGVPLPASLDGTPLPLAAVSDGSLPDTYPFGSPARGPLRSQLLAEFWGEWFDESIHSHPRYPNLTWKAVRVLRSDRAEAYKYVIHCSGEYELYDLVRDPYELTNLLDPAAAEPDIAAATFTTSAGNNGNGAISTSSSADSSCTSTSTAAPSTATAATWPDGDTDGPHDDNPNNERLLRLESDSPAVPRVIRAWAATAWAALMALTRGSEPPLPPPPQSPSSQQPPSVHRDKRARGSGGGAHGARDCVPQAPRPELRDGSAAPAAAAAVAAGPAAGPGSGAAAGAKGGGGGGGDDYAVWLRRLRSRLDAVLAVLAVCGGDSCVRPFQVLHPDGAVSDLWAAMDEQYDDMYGSIQPFGFGRCLPYQDVDNERSPFRAAAALQVAPEAVGDDGYGGGGGASDSPNGGSGACARRLSAPTSSGGAAAPGDSPAAEAAGEPSANAAGVGAGPDAEAQVDRTAGGEAGCAGRGRALASPAEAAPQPPLPLLEADVEGDAVPLPRRYELVVDIYGDSAAQDAMLMG